MILEINYPFLIVVEVVKVFCFDFTVVDTVDFVVVAAFAVGAFVVEGLLVMSSSIAFLYSYLSLIFLSQQSSFMKSMVRKIIDQKFPRLANFRIFKMIRSDDCLHIIFRLTQKENIFWT